MTEDADPPEYWLVPRYHSRTSSPPIKHRPDPDADDELASLCGRTRAVNTGFHKRALDDGILQRYRECRYCDPTHDTTPVGGSKATNDALRNMSVEEFDAEVFGRGD